MLNDNEQKRLNEYLGKIESALKEISVADRSDILLELDGHIKESIETNQQTLDQVLAALGEPLMVANRYLLAKGAKPVEPPKFRWVRNLTLGFAAVMALMVIASVMVVKSFTPLVSVNEKENRVQLLGGLIDIDEDKESFKLKGVIDIEGDDIKISRGAFKKQELRGKFAVNPKTQVFINAHNGKIEVEGTNKEKLEYECEFGGALDKGKKQFIYKKGNVVNFDLGNNLLTGAKCELEVPKNVAVNLKAVNGKIELEDLEQPVTAKLKNGKVKFEKKKNVEYFFRTSVREGKIKGENTNSPSPKPKGAYSVNIEVDKGKVIIK